MRISKDECDKEFAEKKLVLSDEKCKQCEYLYLCPFMSHAMDEVGGCATTVVTANEIKSLEKIRDKYCQWGEVVVIDKVIEKLLRYDIGSGVIIPDVEMPKNCHECDCYGLSDIVGLKCPCDANKELYNYDKRPEECPLKAI